jgi:hypothetical protein
MKNITLALFLSITVTFLSSAYAEPYHSDTHHSRSYQSEYHHSRPYHHSRYRYPKPYRSEDYDKSFIPVDLLIYRPLGLLTTIVGTAVFIGVSPFTALASIPEPHNAFHKTANIFIVAPANYTFSRPLGDTSRFKFPDP